MHTVGQYGDQPGQFHYPAGLALTPDEDFLLVADCGNRRVAVLRALDGAWVRQLTGPPGTLLDPIGVAVVPSTGEVLVSDYGRHRVLRFRLDDGTLVGVLGTGQGSGPTEFQCPLGLAVLDGSHCPLVCFAVYFPVFNEQCTRSFPHRVFTRDGSDCRKAPWSWWSIATTIGWSCGAWATAPCGSNWDREARSRGSLPYPRPWR